MSPQIAIVLVAVFASIALAIGVVASLVFRWSAPESRELRKLASRGGNHVLTNMELTEVAAPWVKHFQQVAPKSPKEMSKLRRRLTVAGYRSLTVAIVYGAAEIILPFLVGGSLLLVLGFSKWYVAMLGAGEESPFVVKIPNAAAVGRYRVGFRLDDGGVVAHVDRRGQTPAGTSGDTIDDERGPSVATPAATPRRSEG